MKKTELYGYFVFLFLKVNFSSKNKNLEPCQTHPIQWQSPLDNCIRRISSHEIPPGQLSLGLLPLKQFPPNNSPLNNSSPWNSPQGNNPQAFASIRAIVPE